MKVFTRFEVFSKALDVFPLAGGTYTKPKINKNIILNAKFVIFLDMDVILNKQEINPQASVQELLEAVFYYLEYDNFQDQ